MPETTRSGIARSTLVMAMFTQSVGVPSTEYTPSATVSRRKGRRSVSACPIALASVSGRNDGDVTQRSKRVSERFEALRVHAVIVGDENTFHPRIISVRGSQVRRFAVFGFGRGTTAKRRTVATNASARPRSEGDRRAKGGPNESKHDARDQRADTSDGVVDAKRHALLRRRREIGDKRTLGALDASVVHAVDQKPRDQR